MVIAIFVNRAYYQCSVPYEIVKNCDPQTLKTWYSILNVYKATLFSLYYKKPLLYRERVCLIRSFNHYLRAVKRTAELRKSEVVNTILFIPERSNSVKPFYKLLNESLQETRSFRSQDNRNQNYLSDYRSKILRS